MKDKPLCQGISVRPSGCLQSLRKRPEGSFVTGILAETNAREMMSLTLRAWCLVIRLGAILHTKARRPHVSTCDPHRQVCAAQRPRKSRKATATRTASSRRRPHEAMAVLTANHRCLTATARKAAFCHGSLLLTLSRADWRPGLSKADCL